MRDDLGLAPGAIHAERRDLADALDAKLPGLVAETHDRLVFKGVCEIENDVRDVAQHREHLAFGHARGDVRAAEEDVDHLASTPLRATRAGARLGSRRNAEACVVLFNRVGCYVDFESVHVRLARPNRRKCRWRTDSFWRT
jgi:hypothetical protein